MPAPSLRGWNRRSGSSDNSAAGSHTEKITIELYGYHPEKSNREWIESGLESIHYQNLSGQCQQSRPVPLVSTSN